MNQETKSRKKKIILVGLGLGTAGLLGYFGWQHYKKKEENITEEDMTALSPSSAQSFSPRPATQPIANDDFPLKQGSKGSRVKALQEALISKYGKAILPKYGADGDFGKEMTTALQSKGLPLSVDENNFNVLVKSRSFEPESLAKSLFNAAINKKYADAIAGLKQMKSVNDYSAVGEVFKNYRINGVRQTLVNAMLNIFNTGTQKDTIRMEFIRMGLKYNGDKWSLSGIGIKQLITIKPAIVWADSQTPINVAINTILGTEIGKHNNYTLFKTIDNKKLIVKTESIKSI